MNKKGYFRIIGILGIAAFSFFYTEKIANLTLDKNELYQSIKKEPVIIMKNILMPLLKMTR